MSNGSSSSSLEALLDALRSSLDEKQRAVQSLRLAAMASRHELRIEERACIARSVAMRQELESQTPNNARILAPLLASRENWQTRVAEAERECSEAEGKICRAWDDIGGACAQLEEVARACTISMDGTLPQVEGIWAEQALPSEAELAEATEREVANLQRAKHAADAELKALKASDRAGRRGEAPAAGRNTKEIAELTEEAARLRGARVAVQEQVEALRAQLLRARAASAYASGARAALRPSGKQ